MNKHLSRFVLALGLLSAAIMSVGHSEDASAKTTNLTVIPSQFHYELDPGTTKSDSIEIRNKSDYAVKFTMEASPYFVQGSLSETDPNMNTTYEAKESYSIITDWVTFDVKEGSLGVDESIEIPFTITVPKDAPGGGQYMALLAKTSPLEESEAEEGASIQETANIGPAVFSVVSGETRKDAEITSHDISGFIFNPPIQASSRVTNNGNIHAEATYILRVYPFFGGESIYNTEENPHKEVVFPGTSRYYNQTWEEAPAIGIYKVQSEVKIFDEVSTIERIVIICPMWVLILIIVFILAVIFWIVARVRARKNS
ncbi:hypothetical protein IJ103_04205 [Candidatus Saccharibacteria bacterium]|nr:hypothetical protein [Candidatus Saccharibacteria bacterium]